ncbi:hypothetical protein F7725_013612 [Dissostichus mawsoni]|uniref:Uncharacterized protein n=1 Tax=Dissostichus mawsoni TaxID=36200 RepID=A0A7J5Y5G5_DISMA|nr:hypothetical protein F7725_013612 [Dissostichus mawsoni]
MRVSSRAAQEAALKEVRIEVANKPWLWSLLPEWLKGFKSSPEYQPQASNPFLGSRLALGGPRSLQKVSRRRKARIPAGAPAAMVPAPAAMVPAPAAMVPAPVLAPAAMVPAPAAMVPTPVPAHTAMVPCSSTIPHSHDSVFRFRAQQPWSLLQNRPIRPWFRPQFLSSEFPLESPLKSPLESPLESLLEFPLKFLLQSPLKFPLKFLLQPLKFLLQSPLESPLEFPLKSPSKSPLESPSKSPLESSLEFPLKSPLESPQVVSRVSSRVPSQVSSQVPSRVSSRVPSQVPSLVSSRVPSQVTSRVSSRVPSRATIKRIPMPRRTPAKIRLHRSQAVPEASRELSRERRDASREASRERGRQAGRPGAQPVSALSLTYVSPTAAAATDLGARESGPSQPILPNYPKTFFGKQRRSFHLSTTRPTLLQFQCSRGYRDSTFLTNGVRDWKNVLLKLQRHAECGSHRQCMELWQGYVASKTTGSVAAS